MRSQTNIEFKDTFLVWHHLVWHYFTGVREYAAAIFEGDVSAWHSGSLFVQQVWTERQ